MNYKDGKKKVYYDIKTKKNNIALTFDIGNGHQTFEKVLHVLEEKSVKKSTFFLSSPVLMSFPEVGKRVKEMGYEIGSHGHNHYNYTEYDNKWIEEQVRKAEEIIFNNTQVRPTLIRTPNGDFDYRVLDKLSEMGYTTIHWSADSLDWMNPGVDVIIERVLSKARPGVIILMHASDTAQQTHKALPNIIDGLRQKGLEFVTVSELINEEQI
ncbi:polysaccharide deacetylase family protein [Aneurinibacillus sp. Ricciae_BoGa-3]|uniref:polysaccharide deacetylase family protein n=1 Tax=Aneurinibacillus sp. Ricciae_BoGa-3 TaxID=3022697 RepID=UPI002341FB56|nr:polysaccharide deacetylase family protein [Aneurinibacillus sp. Ricciae_BoGa-3]WCK53277.1 polysaccharide deacetylase family protein [Aneurinibacillus sp. Ricciae_BoGa-3]